MDTHDEGTGGERAKPKGTKVSPARNAIAAVLLVSLSTVAYLEWNANRQSNAAVRKLNQALAKEDGELLSMEQVENLIGRGPDAPGVDENGEMKVKYSWKGVFRRYPLTTVYTKQSPPRLLRTE
jgi:hypothetical protein